MATIDCAGETTRVINAALRHAIAAGDKEIVLRNTGARHNLAVAVLDPVRIRCEGSVGYYCGGLMDGPAIEITGGAGWGLAESMMGGEVTVRGSAGNGAAAAIRGGTIVIHGDAAARLGVSIKGGLVLVAGNCGYMAGFMGQKGTMIVCGDTGEAFGDSMYATECFVGGQIGGLGTDAVVESPNAEDVAMIEAVFARHLSAEERRVKPEPLAFKKVVAGRKLWNFDRREWKIWQEAL
jgi:glutamate synthase domain-containing protein 3